MEVLNHYRTKSLICGLLLALLAPVIAHSQVNITGTQNTGYYLQIANGDTLHLRGETPFYNTYRIALQDALNFSANNDITVHVRSNMDERVDVTIYEDEWVIEEITDTVYVTETIRDTVYIGETIRDTVYVGEGEVDTVYVNLPPHDNSFLHSVDWTHTVNFETGRERLDFVIKTENVDTLVSGIHCGNQSVEERVWPDLDNDIMKPANTLQYGTFWDCDLDLTYHFRAYKGDWSQAVTKTIPAFILAPVQEGEWVQETFEDFSDYRASYWDQTWGNLEWRVEDGMLILDLINRNIARLQWNLIPEHRNIEYKVTETLHASHASGAHIGARHSEDAEQYSVETYLHGPGLGVSIFNEGSWSNPHTFPFEWESGDQVQYHVRIIDDSIHAKIWHSGDEPPADWEIYSDPVIGEIPDGKFAIGSTGAGLYLINELEVMTLD